MITIKFILRRLIKSKRFLLINVFGLTMAFCTILFLATYVVQEQSFDKHIKNHERIYRLLSCVKEGEVIENMFINLNERKIGLKNNVPEVEEVAQLLRHGSAKFKQDDLIIAGDYTFVTTPNFFKIFDFDVVYGNTTDALNAPNAIVISQKLSIKLFGDIDPVGQQIIADDQLSVITAVIKDIPNNTHFFFDVLKPMTPSQASYESIEYNTYVLFKEGSDYEAAALKCEKQNTNVLSSYFSDMDVVCSSKMEAVVDIHLNTIASWDFKENGNRTLIIFLAILSLAILIIALSNYINLLMAQKETYIKQVSIQKIMGTTKLGMVQQLFFEFFTLIAGSFVLSIFVFNAVKSMVSNYIGVDLFDTVWQTWEIYALIAGVFILSVLLACVFPALQLSRINVSDLIHAHQIKTRAKVSLLIFQFCLVSFLLIGILSIQKQITYIENKPKGFNAENVVNFHDISSKMRDSWQEIRHEIENIPHVLALTGQHSYPGSGGSGQSLSYLGQPAASVNEARVKPGYLEVFGIELKEGRFFDKDKIDRANIVVNEATVRKLGITNPLEAQVEMWGEQRHIIGVVKDYHYSSLKEQIQPLMLTNWQDAMWTLSVRLDGNNNKQVVDQIGSVLQAFDSDYQVVSTYLTARLKRDYAQEHALRRIFYLGTTLGLLIALIGLLAYAAVVAARRTKEIGVRKVNGASNASIVCLLSSNYLKYIVIAFGIACPVAYYSMHKWLSNFAYKTDLSWWIFALAGLLTVTVSLLTISWQSWRTANQNPVKALRYE